MTFFLLFFEWKIYDLQSNAVNKNKFSTNKSWIDTSFFENILFVQAITHCFLKGKLLENNPFMLKMQKWWEKVNFMMSYYKIVGIGIKMKIIKKLRMYILY